MSDHFGKLFRRLRGQTNKTLRDVADYLGVSQPYVSDVERGRRAPFSQKRIQKAINYINAGEKTKELLIAAAMDKGAFELKTANNSQLQTEVGVVLATRWNEFTESELKGIKDIINSGQERSGT